MNRIEQNIKVALVNAFEFHFQYAISLDEVLLQQTRKEIVGDFTINVFPFVRFAKRKPEEIAELLGAFIVENVEQVSAFNVIKGFLNIEVLDAYWLEFLKDAYQQGKYGFKIADENSDPVVIEYSSPNTNKPLHLGHIRNNLLGFSIAEILKADGKNVKKVNLVNDRGIHICKSMLAWQRYGNQETPDSAATKGDHLVGKYYVKFDQEYKVEISQLMAEGKTEAEAKKLAPIIIEAQQMLVDR